MAQKTINVGTVANDGTGDTIRGAFTNVNANFTEVYANVSNLTATVAGIDLGQNTTIEASFNTTNNAFDKANSANLLAYNVGISANLFSIEVGSAGNAYAVVVGTASNSYAQSIGTAGNNYASILSANNAGAANAWANSITTITYGWANSKFETLTNTSFIFNTANASFAKANAALANTTGTFQGNLSVTGTVVAAGFSDGLGPIRERVVAPVNSNSIIQATHSAIIANNSNTIYLKIPDDNIFQLTPNVGTTIDIYQFGTGNTGITANDAAVTIYSSNNWANISGQYLTASLVKVLPNTWILTGDLKA
jgi:hypothetical protein